MSNLEPQPSRDAALKQALADHRAGRSAAAEQGYRALIDADPRHAGANHHLGVLLVQTGRMEEGLARLKSALDSEPAEPLFYFSFAKGLLAAGDPAEAGAIVQRAMQRGLADERFAPLKIQIQDAAVAKYRQALAARPGDAVLLDNLGTALLGQGKVEEAVGCYRQALVHSPDFAEAHFHLGAVLSQHGRVAEGFEHYMRRAALVFGKGMAPGGGQVEPPHKVKHDRAQRDYLWSGKAPADAPLVADMFRLADGDRLKGPAVNPANGTPQLLDAWQSSTPQMVVIDDFLTEPALRKLRETTPPRRPS